MENPERASNHVQTAPPAVRTSGPPRGWPLFLVGVLLCVLGPALYVVQFRSSLLWMPWYVPVLSTLGVALMFVSVWRRRGVVRSLGLAVFSLMCGFEWFLALVVFASPAYTGPAGPSRKLPEFAATLADGRPFTQRDLETGDPTVLVFFRGRW